MLESGDLGLERGDLGEIDEPGDAADRARGERRAGAWAAEDEDEPVVEATDPPPERNVRCDDEPARGARIQRCRTKVVAEW